MNIYYFNRAQGDRFSIERVNKLLRDEISKTCEISSFTVPELRANPVSILKNILFVFKHRNKNGINHITGDIHYCILALIGVKSVLTIHDTVFLEGKQPKIIWLIKWFLWLYLPCVIADKVVCISDKTKKELAKHHIRVDNAIVIHDPVNLKTWNLSKEKTSKIKILHVGTKENKNLLRVIESLHDINCKLLIVGVLSNDILSALKKYDIDYSNYVNLSDDELSKIYFQSDIVSFPSLYEGFGMPIIEGQLAGCAVLTSNISPMSEIGGDSVYYIDPYSVESIRDGFLELINNSELREKLLFKGRENLKRFTPSFIAQEYLNVYMQL